MQGLSEGSEELVGMEGGGPQETATPPPPCTVLRDTGTGEHVIGPTRGLIDKTVHYVNLANKE